MSPAILPAIPLEKAAKLFLAFVLAALCAYWATPKLTAVENPPSLEETLPRTFGEWTELVLPYAQVSLSTGVETDLNQPYDQTVMRAYKNSQGAMVFLAVAWGSKQRQEVKIHRPDLCYAAQGYKVLSLKTVAFDGVPGQVTGKRMLAASGEGNEVVSYWMRIGSNYSEDAVDTRLHILKEGFQGRIPDGVLVRASMRINDQKGAEQIWPILEDFLAALVKASPPETRALMIK